MTIVKVGTGGISNNVVTNAQIAVNTITTDDIEDSVVTATKLAAGAGRTDWQSVVTGDTTMATNK